MNKNTVQKININQGLTLVELLAAMALFSIMIGAIGGLFISAVRSQAKSLANQEIIDQASYALEYMARHLRMAKKELSCGDELDPTSCDCLQTEGYGVNYENPGGDLSRIRFLNYDRICQEFFYQDNQLQEIKSQDERADFFGDPMPLSSSILQVQSLKFFLAGAEQGTDPTTDDLLQPFVTISLDILNPRLTDYPSKMHIQTSVSQRGLDMYQPF